VKVQRCTACYLRAQGLTAWTSAALSYLPAPLGHVVEANGLAGGIWTALRMRELMRIRCDNFRALVNEIDGIVAMREWVKDLLVRNGVPPSKIVLSPHGLQDGGGPVGSLIDIAAEPLRVAFFGRAERVKGIETLIKAISLAPGLNIELDLYGVVQSSADQQYLNELSRMAAGDLRISFCAPIPHEEIVPLLRTYHLLAVPSLWLETGPLIILESFAAGTPVIGSNLGGIAELVKHGTNGLLLDSKRISDWTDCLKRCAEERQFLGQLRRGIEAPRKLSLAADDMAAMYHKTFKYVAAISRA